MRVCIDTNVLVRLFGRNEAHRPIRNALLSGRIELAISNDILFEYQEMITKLSDAGR
jgi:predicted nucleic acid-binding protein